MCQCCQIIPQDVLRRLAKELPAKDPVRRNLVDTAKIDVQIRRLREQARKLTQVTQATTAGLVTLTATPSVAVSTCAGTKTLPGKAIPNPGSSKDGSAKRAYGTTADVVKFYATVFKRNSVDNAGMTLLSSIHYGSKFDNAFWNGQQMVYGDGDGTLFIDFTGGNDVIGHELTHGVTQHTLQLAYVNEAGGLNESLSDVFGSMFRQWKADQTVSAADWLIGSDIMGPQAKSSGYTCLRDMQNPAATHCLAPQPTKFKDYKPGMDPHYSSGIPNKAFYNVATAIGGKSWLTAGQIWYHAMTAYGPSPNLTMGGFAALTKQAAAQLYPGKTAIAKAVNDGWKQVGL